MKYSKRYLAFFLLLLTAVVVRFRMVSAEGGEVAQFRGAQLEPEIWNPLISESVNQNLLSVVIDSREYTNENHTFYMDENLNIMLPVDLLRSALACSAHIYDGRQLLVEKHNTKILFTLDADMVKVNGEMQPLISPFTEKDGIFYVSLNDLSNYLGYSYSWDIAQNKATASDTSESTSIIPVKYDLRDKKRVAKVRNQGTFGTCWAFAALGALESSLLPEEDVQYSADHMTLCNGFHLTQKDGGEYTMGMAYLAAWKGPVYEADDPYGDNRTDETLTAVRHVQEMQVIESKDYEKIKEAVFLYGGVQTSIYNALTSSVSETPYFKKESNAYCYIGTEKPNHDVVIIGWDDQYSKDNFKTVPEGDGAFICQNSWGKNFGEDGVFYISYFDTNIGSHSVCYTRVEGTDNYDHIYQSDLCGWVGQLGYNRESIFGANVFTAEGAEELKAAGFYATGKDSRYELYIVRDFKDMSSFASMIPAASGKLSNAGYYTINFEQGIAVEAGERYAVVLHMTTPNSVHPLAIEYIADEMTQSVVLDDGESYISPNGIDWTGIESAQEANICLKVFSDNQ